MFSGDQLNILALLNSFLINLKIEVNKYVNQNH